MIASGGAGELRHLSAGVLEGGVGEHAVAIRFHGPDLHPGSGGAASPIGPLVLSSQDAADTRVARFSASRASALCGKRWDWVEAVVPRPGG